jgi:hypothetical protein
MCASTGGAMMPQRKSAFSKVLKEAQRHTQQSGETVKRLEGNAVTPLNSDTVKQQSRKAVKPSDNGITLYEGDVLSYASPIWEMRRPGYDHKKPTGQRINRNDIVMYLIDQATLESLAGIKRHVKKQGHKAES